MEKTKIFIKFIHIGDLFLYKKVVQDEEGS